ncbi:probable ATP-dependent RNA helicase DHX34 [Nilaparvata lugens]|uniref:probable ATP-dependent RNA helicase DHX34 n=1 Tax=Nilaparvata lugens TaxID=108931 RepID=UPI00193D34CD|nr:probable ATP-dependent RNA helicase DHX34 [Nilaparvata lugens]XP_039283141.1 probable ATP-dependent RNA helicase DHX34 [Nilaparvata lugens]
MPKHKKEKKERHHYHDNEPVTHRNRNDRSRRGDGQGTSKETSRSTGDTVLDGNASNIESFLSESFKYSVGKYFLKRNFLIEDVDDFWLFVKKYEGVHKRAQKVKPNFGIGGSSRINIDLSTEVLKCLRVETEKLLSSNDQELFVNILRLYLDFKQKEKFNKFYKLRQSQKNLPVAQYKKEIIEAVKNERVIIIAGDTGCGKSTQVPQYLMKAGYNRVACTQPRRIACVSLSKRVAYESLNEYTTDIGYQIRFEKHKNQSTKIVFITEGLLLRQLSGEDGAILDYDVIILDEIHERHLYGDFLLGIVKCLLHQKQLSHIRVVLMSATININLFTDFFGDNTRVIQVPGRLYPITLHYKPIPLKDQIQLSNKKDEAEAVAPYVQIMQLIDSKYPETERGDLLIFVAGISDITAIVDAAKQYNEKVHKWIILSLHSSLSVAEQDKVFDYAPEGIRKCIVSTNIAETSVTIDGVRFVVDSGKVKENSYDPVCKVQRLKKFQISRASAEQRKGRAGRTGPGVCFRIYSEEDYSQMQEYTTPEIQRVPLDSLLLQMVTMGLPDARKFPFIEPPPIDSIETSILALKQHEAMTDDEKVTVLGRALSKLPVDIPLGKMLITGSMFHQVESVLSLTSVLSVMTPFTNKASKDISCKTLIKELESDHGDPITLLNIFREWLDIKNNFRKGDRGAVSSRQWCQKRGLEEQRFYEMTKLRAQFKTLLQDCSLLETMERDSYKDMSSKERALRHGEVKLLKDMKRSYDQTPHRKAKILKADRFELALPDEDECGGNDGPIDIRDIDFRLSNDSRQVQSLVSGSTASSHRDLTLLKVILCSGLYPQYAIPDEFNSCKSVSAQLYHTKNQPGVWLHPLSIFNNQPEILQIDAADIVEIETIKNQAKNPFSHKHQILFHMSLFETTKTFLVNNVRMPAAQSLLLFAHQIHTNSDFSRIVCDSWLELQFATSSSAEVLLLKAVGLRNMWKRLLYSRLDEQSSDLPDNIENKLAHDLVQFMNCQIVYRIKRLLAADLKTIYIQSNATHNASPDHDEQSHNTIVADNDINPFIDDFKIQQNIEFGGLEVTPYLVYSCLYDDHHSYENWTCPACETTAAFTSLERLQHMKICKVENEKTSADKEPDINHAAKKPNSQLYECDVCCKKIYLTPVEILKHKKSHQTDKTTN